MRSASRIRWIAWTGAAGAHGLVALSMLVGLQPTTRMMQEPIMMSAELAEVRGGEVVSRAPSAPSPAPAVESASAPAEPETKAEPLKPPPPPEVVPLSSAIRDSSPRTEAASAASQPTRQAVADVAPPSSGPIASTPVAAPARRVGNATGMDVDAPHGAGKDYASRLRTWLESHKTYPRKARMRREEGIVEIRFVVDRTGHVLDGDVIRSSGHQMLDAEVIAMLARADPFPPAPRHLRGERIEISAPVEFFLNR
ncbi:energy transducer TonB [Caulobacter segnis]|uniref:energy transducer TonB n=1 Tax=Caulobacter segnis TaxID=88688 RepID=UPI00240F2521|nr:energy transducer TonB [Caulobacter segnis]MDG2523086.1 energy transducer TonB [Caulobacter segnis]